MGWIMTLSGGSGVNTRFAQKHLCSISLILILFFYCHCLRDFKATKGKTPAHLTTNRLDVSSILNLKSVFCNLTGYWRYVQTHNVQNLTTCSWSKFQPAKFFLQLSKDAQNPHTPSGTKRFPINFPRYFWERYTIYEIYFPLLFCILWNPRVMHLEEMSSLRVSL